MIKVRAEAKEDDKIAFDYECSGNAHDVMQELICIIAYTMKDIEPAEGVTMEELVRELPEMVLESMKINGVNDNARE